MATGCMSTLKKYGGQAAHDEIFFLKIKPVKSNKNEKYENKSIDIHAFGPGIGL